MVEDLTTPEAIMYIDDVPDWNERMDLYQYTQAQRDLVA